jgi:hypothetical protein
MVTDIWQYKTNNGPTKALIVDHEGFTICEIVNRFNEGKRFEKLCSEICQLHNDLSDTRRILADAIAAG